MQVIETVAFEDSAAPMVRAIVAEARSLAGESSVFRANEEIRAAVVGATQKHKGNGLFLMIAATRGGAKVWFPREMGLSPRWVSLDQASFNTVVADMHRSFALMKVKLEETGRVARSKRDANGAILEQKAPRNPAWTRDELILTLDLYFRLPPWTVNATHPEIQRLSEELQRLSAHVDPPDAARYRNVNGTYMKMMNFQSLDPARDGRRLKGAGRADKSVWDEFFERREELTEVASGIRSTLANPELLKFASVAIDDADFTDVREGRLVLRVHIGRERDPKIVKAKRHEALKKEGALRCEVCRFDFFARYGELGREFLECHHILHLSKLPEGHRTQLNELALVCANCHRMLHRSKEWLSIESLRELLVR